MRFRYNTSGVAAALATSVVLAGCSGGNYDTEQAWFTKPFQFVSRTGGYTFSELQESRRLQHPVTANDLVDSSGACPPQAAQQPPPAAPANQAGNQAANAPPPVPDSTSLLGGGVALGMTECDVVLRAGQPSSVQLGNAPNGERTAVLTYNGGPRAGIHHFERGQLAEMDRVAVPAPAPQPVKKKSAKSQKKNDQT